MKKWIYKISVMLLCAVLIIVLSVAAQKSFGANNGNQISAVAAAYLKEGGITKYKIEKIPVPEILEKSVTIHCTEKEIGDYITSELQSYDSLEETDKKIVQQGDFVRLEYASKKSFRDSQETVLKVGNNLFDEEIEKALIGKEKEKIYTMKSSTGEAVYIKVSAIVKYVQQTLTDQFLKETLGFTSRDEYEAYVRDEIFTQKKQEKEAELISSFYDRLLSESDITLDEKEVSEFCMKYHVKNEQQMAIAYNKSFEEYIRENYQLEKEEYYNRIYEQGETEIKQIIITGVLAAQVKYNESEDFNEMKENVLHHFISINYIEDEN